MREKYPLGFFTFLILYLLAVASIENLIDRHQSVFLGITYLAGFICFFFVVQERKSFRLLFGIGLVARVFMFFSLPTLSNDIYRFIWDGTLLANGIHPFENLPSYYLGKGIEGVTPELYAQLNSPGYFTIYPPINQFFFWLGAEIGQGNWLVSMNIIRGVLLLADLGSFWLLIQLLKIYEKPLHLAFWYWLNPLVILEFTGSGHFEGLVILFLLAGIYLYETNKKWVSGGAFGLAIGTKLLPFIYLPYVLLTGIRSKKWGVAIIGGVIGLISLLPLYNEAFISGMKSSLNLYFQTFEFNASFYYLIREIGFWIYGYNNIALIGPGLSLISAILIIVFSHIGYRRKWRLPKAFLFILFIYLSFATTIHPWYTIPLIVFGILSGYYFPIVWSFTIFITYLGYTQTGFQLPLYWILIEYLTVFGIFAMEVFGRKPIQTE